MKGHSKAFRAAHRAPAAGATVADFLLGEEPVEGRDVGTVGLLQQQETRCVSTDTHHTPLPPASRVFTGLAAGPGARSSS